MDRSIIFYDGDGGGFASHVRHLAHLQYLSWSLSIPLKVSYPLLDKFYTHDFERFQGSALLNNSMLLENWLDSPNKLIEFKNQISSGRLANYPHNIKFFLSGRHHGPPMWHDFDRARYFINTRNLMRSITRRMKFRYINNIDSYLNEMGVNVSKPFIGIQLRSFYDSPSGRAQYSKCKLNQFKIFTSIVSDVIRRTSIEQLCIFSDDLAEASDLQECLSGYVKVHIDKHKVMHSSMANAASLGPQVLINCDNIIHQVNLLNHYFNMSNSSVANDLSYAIGTLYVIHSLARAACIICSSTSMGPLAASFANEACELIVIPNTSLDMVNGISRYGPYA